MGTLSVVKKNIETSQQPEVDPVKALKEDDIQSIRNMLQDGVPMKMIKHFYRLEEKHIKEIAI